MATGLAGDAVTAACLATTAPVVVAPAMDGEMYAHPATRANVARLRDDFGYRIVEPAAGPLASGQSGQGRLAETADDRRGRRRRRSADDRSAARTRRRGRRSSARPARATSTGATVVISAGGTAEPIDPVRFIGNRSTGKMGVALAEAAVGARRPGDPRRRERQRAAAGGRRDRDRPRRDAPPRWATPSATRWPGADALIMAAAVADFRPRRSAATKLTPRAGPDARARADRGHPGRRSPPAARRQAPTPAARPVLVGFAAETGSLDRAADKLRRKGVDFLVANDVSEPGSGFGTDTNRVVILGADGSRAEPAAAVEAGGGRRDPRSGRRPRWTLGDVAAQTGRT